MDKCLQQNKRVYGIDLLKSIAMLLVVLEHLVSYGGDITTSVGTTGVLVFILRLFTAPAVNIFVLVTGYVYATSKYKFSRIVMLWFEVLLYSVVLSVLGYLFGYISLAKLAVSFVPVISRTYWFFSSYFILFLLIPFLNYILKKASFKQLSYLLVILFVIICGYAWLANSVKDSNLLRKGYSSIWFVVLYLLGAYLHIYEDKIKAIKTRYVVIILFAIFLLSIALPYLVNSLFFNTLSKYGLTEKVFPAAYSYISPSTTIIAICAIMIFSRIQIRSDGFKRVLTFVSPCVFAVYLISDSKFIRSLLISNTLTVLNDKIGLVSFLAIIALAIIVFVLCIFVDYLRAQLFKIIKIDTLSKKIGDFFSRKFKFDE